jgi:2-oxoglutarate ferredoxin oxidoreductase subunit delta
VERCKGCELCVECCPLNVLELSTDFNAKGYHYPVVVSDDCIDCQACREICPEFAIFSLARASLVTSAAAVGSE